MKTYRVILADDHVIFCQGLKKIVEEIPGLTVVGQANDGLELLTMLKSITADLVILDISMPNIRGIEAAREIQFSHPGLSVLILSMYKSREYLYHCLSAGVKGYLLKDESDVELNSAIATIRKGGVYISCHLQKMLTDDLSQRSKGEIIFPTELLTTREIEVLKMVAEGKTNKEIAELLFISIRTVENHRANMMKKLSFKKTADLVRYAVQKDYVSSQK